MNNCKCCGKEINDNEEYCKFCKNKKNGKKVDIAKIGVAVLGVAVFAGKIAIGILTGKKNIS